MLQKRASQAAAEAQRAEDREAEAADTAEREHRAGRRYSGTRVGRSSSRTSRKSESFGETVVNAVFKELKGTTGRRIVRGLLGGLFKGR